MKVTILVPVYCAEKFIERCARSLLGQTFEDIEYVFVDDCSPDSSIAVIEKVQEEFPYRKSQIKIVRHTRNNGSACARNTALDNATGRYVMFVDSDDYIESDAVRLLHDKAMEESADMVVFDMKQDFGNKTIDMHELIPVDKHDYVKNLLLRCGVVGVWGKLYDRSLFGSDIRFTEGINFGEDYMIIPRLAYKAGKIVKLDKVLYGYVRTNAGSITKVRSLERDERNMHDIENAVRNLCDFFSQVPERDIYNGICDKIKAVNKAALLKCSSTKEIRRRVARLYPESNRATHTLGIIDKLVLLQADLGLWTLLDVYVKIGAYVKIKLASYRNARR